MGDIKAAAQGEGSNVIRTGRTLDPKITKDNKDPELKPLFAVRIDNKGEHGVYDLV